MQTCRFSLDRALATRLMRVAPRVLQLLRYDRCFLDDVDVVPISVLMEPVGGAVE